jgi:MFS superfamily sulfate permease-like transporter
VSGSSTFNGLEVLEQLEQSLHDKGVQLHLAKVKGTVMDRLKQAELHHQLEGRIHLSTDGTFVLGASEAASRESVGGYLRH